MNEEMIMDQSPLAEDLAKKIHFDMLRDFLVKPLDVIMVKKEFDKPVATDTTPTKDDNDVEAVDYDKVETEVKEVESDFRKAVVLKVPQEYETQMKNDTYPVPPIHVGDVIVYTARAGRWFDLLKDTQLVRSFDIVAIEETK